MSMRPQGWLGRFFARFNRALDRVTDRYIDLTARFTHRPLRALLVLGALVVALLLLFRAVPGGFVPEEDQAYLMANLQLPDAASLERTHAAAAKVEAILRPSRPSSRTPR